MTLTELQLDTLKESFNVGAGRAAAVLEELMDHRHELELSVPNLVIKSVKELDDEITAIAGIDLFGVVEGFEGTIQGSAVLLYSQWESLELIKVLLGEDVPVEDLPTLQGEALLETGNVVLNACLSGMADMLGEEFGTMLPELRRGSCLEILDSAGYSKDDNILYLRMRFSLKGDSLSGHIGFSMDVSSESGLVKCINRYVKETLGL